LYSLWGLPERLPVFGEIGGHAYVGVGGEKSPYPGPIGSIISAGMFGQAEYGQLARASSLCGACQEICPVDMDLPKLLLRVRAGQVLGVSKDSEVSNAPRSIRWSCACSAWLPRIPGCMVSFCV